MIVTSSELKTGEQSISVSLGEIVVTKDTEVSLACYGLGSCICVCSYDPDSRVAGMAHIVLPESHRHEHDKNATKYADIAVPALIEEMLDLGADRSRIVIKLAGGSQMIQSIEYTDALDVGSRNLAMTEKALKAEGFCVSGSDTGGNRGRSVWMFVESGKVMVRKIGEVPEEI